MSRQTSTGISGKTKLMFRTIMFVVIACGIAEIVEVALAGR